MSLTVFKTDDGIELVIDDQGEVHYPGYRALARVASIGLTKEIHPETVKRAVEFILKGVTNLNVFEAEIITQGGLQGVTIIPRTLGTKVIKKYNDALFDAMADAGHLIYLHKLAGYNVTSTAVEQPKTALEYAKLFVASEEARIAAEEKAKLLEVENEDLIKDVDKLSEIVDELFDYSSIIRVAKFNNCSETAFNWRKLKAASSVKKLEIKRAPCPRYVTKNLYHHDVWRLVYPDFKLPETTTLVIKK